jgi:hypothetical protein
VFELRRGLFEAYSRDNVEPYCVLGKTEARQKFGSGMLLLPENIRSHEVRLDAIDWPSRELLLASKRLASTGYHCGLSL